MLILAQFRRRLSVPYVFVLLLSMIALICIVQTIPATDDHDSKLLLEQQKNLNKMKGLEKASSSDIFGNLEPSSRGSSSSLGTIMKRVRFFSLALAWTSRKWKTISAQLFCYFSAYFGNFFICEKKKGDEVELNVMLALSDVSKVLCTQIWGFNFLLAEDCVEMPLKILGK